MKDHNDGAWMEMFVLFASVLISFGSIGHNWRVAALNILLGLIVLWRQETRIKWFWNWWGEKTARDFAELSVAAEKAQNVAWLNSAIRDRKHIDMLTAVCRLASRSTEIQFADPGDAVRWSKVIGDYEKYAREFGCAPAPSQN